MSGTSEGGRKAAETRKARDPNAFRRMGEMGAEKRHNKSAEEESAIARKSAATRIERDPDTFKKMGHQGGIQSASAARKQKEEMT